jgi:hypothetical protein
MSEQIEKTKVLLLDKQNEILKCLDGVSYLNCQLILSSVKNELDNVSFVQANN